LVALVALVWALGLSLRRTALVLALLGLPTSYLSVWRAVQLVGQGLRSPLAGRLAVLGLDGTGVRLAGATTGLVVVVDVGTGQVLDLWLGDEHDPQAVVAWLAPLVRAYGVEVLVVDDLGSHGTVATALGCARQVCAFHLQRWVGRALRRLATELDERWHPLLTEVRALVRELPPDGGARLLALWQALHAIPHPPAGPHAPELRLRALLLRLSEQWASYRVAASHADVPATNNRTEQAIGRIKLRSRTVRGYKSADGLRHGSRLAAAVGTGQPLDLAATFAVA
jgi:transposase-like protein